MIETIGHTIIDALIILFGLLIIVQTIIILTFMFYKFKYGLSWKEIMFIPIDKIRTYAKDKNKAQEKIC